MVTSFKKNKITLITPNSENSVKGLTPVHSDNKQKNNQINKNLWSDRNENITQVKKSLVTAKRI